MTPPHPRARRRVVVIFFCFMLLHQADKLLIGPLTTPIMETFGINEAQMGGVFTGALLVSAVLYPLWGYLYDRYARPRLIAAAAFIWGLTTWLSAVAPTYGTFLATRASTGIDDSSYPGIFSLIADYFTPEQRGRIIGLLQLTAPIGYMAGLVLALVLGQAVGWRAVFYITGSLGIVLAAAIFWGVRDVPRGRSDPELADLEEIGLYKFDWRVARAIIRKPSLRFLFLQGFFGVFPWNVITYWFFRYLEVERNYDAGQVLTTMAAAVVTLSAGYYAGGWLGDRLFARTLRARPLVGMVGVIAGAILLWATLSVPLDQTLLFGALLMVTAFFIPFAAPNVMSTVTDVTVPEVRSTALAIQLFIESGGAALAPLLAGVIAVNYSLQTAILLICIAAWALCALFFAGAAWKVTDDIGALRAELHQRAVEATAAAD